MVHATPIAEMQRLIAQNPRNAERIFPYIGGEEVNDSPTHSHHRYVINFGDMTENEARQWPDLMAIVEAKVKPRRLQQNGRRSSRALVAIMARPRRDSTQRFRVWTGLVVCTVEPNTCRFAFLPHGIVFSRSS